MPVMPRKATPAQPDVADAITVIKLHCQTTGVSILSLSTQAGVAQSALARFISGERKSITETAKKVLAHISKRHNQHNRHNDDDILPALQHNDQEGYRLIHDAISSLWDGKRQSAELIASLVLALKPALEIAVDAQSGGQKGS
jgi:hypothetical protein